MIAHRAVCLGLCLFALRAPAGAQPAEAWRYWTAADGMRESFVRALTLASDGYIWVRHGAVDALSVLDGYAVTKVPEARKGNIVDWGLLGRVSACKDDEAWLVEDHALRRYAQRQWKIVEREAPGRGATHPVSPSPVPPITPEHHRSSWSHVAAVAVSPCRPENATSPGATRRVAASQPTRC